MEQRPLPDPTSEPPAESEPKLELLPAEEQKETPEPDRQFEEKPLPSVRAPLEGSFCLARLAALAAAAS